MRRRPTPEFLDSDSGTPTEVGASLRDLQWFNRWFGGLSTMQQLVLDAAATSRKTDLTILDVASGDGYVLGQVSSELAAKGIQTRFTLLDRSPSHLPRNGNRPKVAADAVRLPFSDSSFDFVASSLFVHHLAPAEVVMFGREALRVAKHGILVHDLIRDPVHLAFAYAGVPLYRSRITRNDAPASVRQAYTAKEMEGFLRKAGADDIRVRRQFFYRMGILARKRSAQ